VCSAARILDIIQVEQTGLVDQSHRYGCDVVKHRIRREGSCLDQFPYGQSRRHPSARDTGTASSTIGLDNVAIKVQGTLAERFQVKHCTQAAPDQALDFLRTPALLSTCGF